MYKTGRQNRAYVDAVRAAEILAGEISKRLTLVAEDAQPFDLVQWAQEFSKARWV